jgi:hypothetical protein
MPLLDAVLGWITLVSGLSGFVAWPIFCFLSMRPIEAKVRAEGRDRTGWDGVGGRVVVYAFVLSVPFPTHRMRDYPLIDVEAVRQHANPRDKKLATWLTLSLSAMTLSALGIGVFS